MYLAFYIGIAARMKQYNAMKIKGNSILRFIMDVITYSCWDLSETMLVEWYSHRIFKHSPGNWQKCVESYSMKYAHGFAVLMQGSYCECEVYSCDKFILVPRNFVGISVLSVTKLWKTWAKPISSMMSSSNGKIFRITGNLCGEFTGHRWIPRTKASDAELWCFLWPWPEWTVE